MNNNRNTIDVDFLVPKQEIGQSCNNYQSHTFTSINEANEAFNKLLLHFIDINNWGLLNKKVLAKFTQRDINGYKIHDTAKKGNSVQVMLGGFRNIFYHGGDWVEIIMVEYKQTSPIKYARIILKPVCVVKNKKDTPSHFLNKTSSNTIILALEAKTIQASVHGRNETLNISQDVSIPKRLRNYIIGKIGFGGLNKLQWQGLCDGLIKKIYEK